MTLLFLLVVQDRHQLAQVIMVRAHTIFQIREDDALDA